MNKPENPPAFPNIPENGVTGGMTMRDWFSGQALIGYVTAKPDANDSCLASWSYATADAMLAERKKGREA